MTTVKIPRIEIPCCHVILFEVRRVLGNTCCYAMQATSSRKVQKKALGREELNYEIAEAEMNDVRYNRNEIKRTIVKI